MGAKLIRLEDGTLVEVEVPESEVQPIAGSLADKVEATMSKIKPVLLKTCKPIAEAVKDMRDDVDLDQVEVELGLSFESEGNIYIAKAKLGANIIVRMTLTNK
jgi:Trypsin-co-occurring domain 1